MNKIELLKRAANLYTDTSGRWANADGVDRLVELIVRECMKESMAEIVSDENIEQESDPLLREYLHGNNQGIVDAVVRFRNHFGVQE